MMKLLALVALCGLSWEIGKLGWSAVLKKIVDKFNEWRK